MAERKKGDLIRYDAYGECLITDRREENIGGKTREFFVLTQISSSSTIFVPVEKESSFKDVKKPLTVEEIASLKSAKCDCVNLTADDKTRDESYKKVIANDDIADIAGLYINICAWQKKLKSEKKKLRTTDVTAMKMCEKILYDEFSRTVDLRQDDVSLILSGELEPVLKQQ